jgi:muconolactone delta-isomerase
MRYMVTLEIVIPDAEREAALALVPKEKAHVAALTQRRVIEAFYLAADRARSWMVMRADSPSAVEAELRQFPMSRFLSPRIVALG